MKFATIDERYLTARRELSKKYGPREIWSVIDHWPVYCGISNLARFLAISDILRSTLHIPGHLAEFGSWRGANLMFLSKLLRVYDPHGQKVVHCFDSFQGLTNFTSQDSSTIQKQGAYVGSLEELKDFIRLYELEDEIVIHAGIIEDTLPALVANNKTLSFSFVFCDTDLYEPTGSILELVHPRLMKGGVFVFDQWNSEAFPGEGIAVNQFLQKFAEYYEVQSVQRARHPTLVMRKTKM